MKILKCKKIIGTFFLCITIIVILFYNGKIYSNMFTSLKYSVHGIDVSNHQKDIDWRKVSQNGYYKFAFIKATEGKDFKDKCFNKNWNEALKVGILVGAYHYFTISSSGKEQAHNFITVVPKGKGFLPPVIDIEESGLAVDKFRKELNDYINIIGQHYGQKPILYVKYASYNQYIKGYFDEYPIWIRDIIKLPYLSNKRNWLFWQYSSNGRCKGISTFVDLDTYRGKLSELKILLSQ